MTHPTQDVLDWLGQQHRGMLNLLADLVNIDSGTRDAQGVADVGKRIESFLLAHGVPVEWHGGEEGGDAMTAGAALPPEGGHLLLMGHRDTVFPRGEVQRRPFTMEGRRAFGPGVADMKAGLVMNAFILAAYRRFPVLKRPLIGLFTTDEEIGSPRSRRIIRRTARGARAVFNAEPARPNGNVVTSRKGGTFLRVEVHGKAAHAGANFTDGISAVEELAHKILRLKAITNLGRGITINVGTVRGGQSVNTVPAIASATVDLRYTTKEDRDTAIAAIEGIVSSSSVSGTNATVQVDGEFDAFCSNQESADLFRLYREGLADVGVQIEGEFSGGCADSGITSALRIPTVCAVGPVGGKVHTEDEYLDIDSMVPRAQGLALTLARLAAA